MPWGPRARLAAVTLLCLALVGGASADEGQCKRWRAAFATMPVRMVTLQIGAKTVAVRVTIQAAGRYTAWLGGDWFGDATVAADGHGFGSKRGDLNWPDNYTDLGSTQLSAGEHVITFSNATGGWRPGSAPAPADGPYAAYPIGPLVLSPADDRQRVETIPPSKAASLCGRSLDWIEAVR